MVACKNGKNRTRVTKLAMIATSIFANHLIALNQTPTRGTPEKKTHFNDVFTHAIVNFRWQLLACPHHNIIILRLLQFWLQINFHLPRSLILRTICNRNVEKYLIGPIRVVKMQFFFLKILILTRSQVDLVFWRLESIQWS